VRSSGDDGEIWAFTSVTDPQPDTAMEGVADRLRTGRAVEEEVGDPAIGDAEAETAAILEPVLISDRLFPSQSSSTPGNAIVHSLPDDRFLFASVARALLSPSISLLLLHTFSPLIPDL